jgi:hypothetical protein
MLQNPTMSLCELSRQRSALQAFLLGRTGGSSGLASWSDLVVFEGESDVFRMRCSQLFILIAFTILSAFVGLRFRHFTFFGLDIWCCWLNSI